jgi:RNA ligase
LVTNSKGEIVSRCLTKFFNWEQLLSVNYPIPDEPFDLYEKMDGQLGLLFWYEDEWILASRGSFISIYAEKARKMLEEKYNYTKLDHSYTYIFEIIFKEGRIVCKYDFEGLVMLAAIHIKDNIELDIHKQNFEDLGFVLVKKYDGVTDYTTLKETISDDAEGYVIKFKSGFRMKIKGEEYCRLHSILTHISSRDIWKYLKDGLPLNDLLEHVPDEFDEWVHNQIGLIRKKYQLIENRVINIYKTEIEPQRYKTRKEYAMKIMTYDKSLRGIFFNMLDGRDYSPLIWEKVYPKYSKPFIMNDSEGDDN